MEIQFIPQKKKKKKKKNPQKHANEFWQKNVGCSKGDCKNAKTGWQIMHVLDGTNWISIIENSSTCVSNRRG